MRKIYDLALVALVCLGAQVFYWHVGWPAWSYLERQPPAPICWDVSAEGYSPSVRLNSDTRTIRVTSLESDVLVDAEGAVTVYRGTMEQAMVSVAYIAVSQKLWNEVNTKRDSEVK